MALELEQTHDMERECSRNFFFTYDVSRMTKFGCHPLSGIPFVLVVASILLVKIRENRCLNATLLRFFGA